MESDDSISRVVVFPVGVSMKICMAIYCCGCRGAAMPSVGGRGLGGILMARPFPFYGQCVVTAKDDRQK